MRRKFIQGLVMLAVSAAFSAHAATATLTAGSAQTVTLTDPKGSGKQVTLSVPSGGVTHLEFSNGLTPGVTPKALNGAVAVANTLKHVISAQDGGVVNKSLVTLTTGKILVGYINFDANVAELAIDAATAKISSVKSTGAISIKAPNLPDVADGGAFGLKNIRIDIQNRRVVADISSAPLGWDSVRNVSIPGVETTLKEVVLWTFDMPVGVVDLPVAVLASGTQSQIQALGYEVIPNGRGGFDVSNKLVLSNLRFTAAGMSAYTNALGLTEGSYMYGVVETLNTRPYGWGNITLTTKLSTSPPPVTCTP